MTETPAELDARRLALLSLLEPFPTDQIGLLPRVTCPDCSHPRKQCENKLHKKERCGECNAYVSPKHIHIDYVGHADVTQRLIERDPFWQWEPFALDEDGLPKLDHDDLGNPVGMWIRLTVLGVTRPGYGSVPSNQHDAIKVLIGDCLLRGTPIRTARGVVRIEDVHVGDLVPTRKGWRRVSDHWLSHPAAPTKAVLLADGRLIVGTPHHRVPTVNRGLQRIEALRNGDMLYTWQDTARTQAQTRSSGTGVGTGGSQIIPTGIVASTSWRRPHRATTYTSTSMKRRTAQSPRAGTSITATLTRLITDQRTSSHSRQRITPSGTANTWSPTSGTATNAASRTKPYAGGAAGVLLLVRNAGDAETGLPTFAPARGLSRTPAPARNVEPSSWPSDPGHASAPVPVVAVLDAGPGEVWNLSVEDVHEYVANGVIVQNSLRNAAQRFGIALAQWQKGDRANPAAENPVADAGQRAMPARQRAADAQVVVDAGWVEVFEKRLAEADADHAPGFRQDVIEAMRTQRINSETANRLLELVKQHIEQLASVTASGLPANKDGSVARSKLTDEELAANNLMTGPEVRAHGKLAKDTVASPKKAERLPAVPPDDPWVNGSRS